MLSDKILDAVAELDNTQGSWSIWNITQNLYKKFGNFADWEDNGVPFNLRHGQVRDIFLTMDWGEYDIIQYNPYRIFQKKMNQTNQIAMPQQMKISGSSWNLQWTNIVAYLQNRGQRTAKQIQSALKKNGIKCSDIVNEAQKNGAKVIPNSYPSKTVIEL